MTSHLGQYSSMCIPPQSTPLKPVGEVPELHSISFGDGVQVSEIISRCKRLNVLVLFEHFMASHFDKFSQMSESSEPVLSTQWWAFNLSHFISFLPDRWLLSDSGEFFDASHMFADSIPFRNNCMKEYAQFKNKLSQPTPHL